MKALIRDRPDGRQEVIIEPLPKWVIDNLSFLLDMEKDQYGNPVKGDGWVLVENYTPKEEP